jgi:hypothetical protein
MIYRSKKQKVMGLWCLLWFSATTVCYAQSHNLSVVVATGAKSVTCEQGKRIVRDVQAIYSRTGIQIKLKRFRCIANPKKSRDRLTGYGIDNTHWWWDEDYFVEKNFRKFWLHHAILPPIQHEGELWMAGQAYLSCSKFGRKIGTSNAMIANALGEPRYNHSVIAMAHEVGHMLGAKHDNSLPATIMHEAALRYVNVWQNNLPLSQTSLNEIKQCNK